MNQNKKIIKNFKYDLVLASKLKRTQQTAKKYGFFKL